MGSMGSQITSLTIDYSTVYSAHIKGTTSKLRATGLCAGNSPGTGEFPAQRASNAENVSIWWRHHDSTDSVAHNYCYDLWVKMWLRCLLIFKASGGRFKNTYELLNLRALKFSTLYKIIIFQCMGKIFYVEFKREPLKFHTKYLTHTLKHVIIMQHWNVKSSYI